ncbi:MAG TPA: type I-E CRISPR-associated protein Cse1/CasA [Intrasporangiaceae bacterium]|nr:type I-E CRISPR-associated protein Cse1/CasA [Intrasporangiaceae bacterium]
MTETFNLIDEAWIDVLDTNGRARSVSIRGAFDQARELRRIAGELPTQDAAILRLLLAILHRALPIEGDDEIVEETWAGWWRDGGPPGGPVDDYLDDWHDRFDLIDESRPFFQVADLHTASGKTSGLRALIADLPANLQFFTNRAAEGADSLTLAEAARWLVHCQAFDVSGIKSGAVGDDRVKGGRGYPIGTGWAGNLGLIVIEGRNLAETLLLNLVLTKRSGDDDLPPWEASAWSPAATGQESPHGPAEAMTWQARRIRLHRDGDRVVDALVSNGDKIRVRNQHQTEPMSAWRRSAAQEKKHGEDQVYMPRGHLPERAIWRGLDVLIAADDITQGSESGAESLASANTNWVGGLRAHDHIDRDSRVTLHTVGVQYGTQSAFVETVIDDRLTLHADVLADPDLQDRATRAAGVADTVARHVGRLAGNLAQAAGRDGEHDRARAVEGAYQRLDPLYRAWVHELTSTNAESHETGWKHLARSTALSHGRELYAMAPVAALRGRFVTDRSGQPRRIDAALAYRWFTHQIWSDIPDAERTARLEKESA